MQTKNACLALFEFSSGSKNANSSLGSARLKKLGSSDFRSKSDEESLPLHLFFVAGVHPEGRIEVGFWVSLSVTRKPHPIPLLLGEGVVFPPL